MPIESLRGSNKWQTEQPHGEEQHSQDSPPTQSLFDVRSLDRFPPKHRNTSLVSGSEGDACVCLTTRQQTAGVVSFYWLFVIATRSLIKFRTERIANRVLQHWWTGFIAGRTSG